MGALLDEADLVGESCDYPCVVSYTYQPASAQYESKSQGPHIAS